MQDQRLGFWDMRALNARRTWRQGRRVCHVPEKGLFFGLRGNVYSCCFNKGHLLGTYPAQGVAQIWEGAQAAALRKAIRDRDLSLGCGGCHALVKARNINALPILSYDRFADDNGGWPAKMDFELFNTCNLECIMCRGEFSSSIRKNREGLPPIDSPYDAAFFDQLEPYIPHLRNSHFLGGEPFLIPQYVDLWERIAHLNPDMSVSVQTNCTVLNQRTKDLLGRMRFDISVSIDSVHRDNYARIRVNGNWDRVLEHLRFFRDYTRQRGTLLTMAYCPMPQNWHELHDAVAFANTWGMQLMFTTVETPSECSLAVLPAARLAEVVAGLRSHAPALPQGNPVERQNRQSYLDLLGQVEFWQVQAQQRAAAGMAEGVQDIAAYIARIERVLRDEGGHSQAEAARLSREIGDKLRYILDVAAQHGRREEAERKLVATAPELVIRSVPGLEKEALVELFQQFVLPME